MIASSPPVFIVGLGRSGSTLVSRMIDAHPQVAILPETHMYGVLDFLGGLRRFDNSWQYTLFLNEVWSNLAAYPDPAAAVLAEFAAELPNYEGPTKTVIEGMGQAYARVRSANLWGEKTPGHALWLQDIREMFPSAKIIVTVRDPRDVLVSYCQRWNRGRFNSRFVMESAANIRFHLDCLRHAEFPPEQVHWIHYEYLTAEPEKVMRGVCRFLQVDFFPQMLTFYESHQNIERETPDGVHHRLLSGPVSRERVGLFRKAFEPPKLAMIEEFLIREMAWLGYTPEAATILSPGPRERRAKRRGVRCYTDICSGKIRKRQRDRMQLKAWLYRRFARLLLRFPSTRLAVTSEDWRARCERSAVKASRQFANAAAN